MGAAQGLVLWQEHYGSFAAATAGATTAFVQGVGVLAAGIGIPETVAVIFASVVVISFAATTLDTAIRLQRYIIAELGVEYNVKWIQNRLSATGIAVVSCGVLALATDRGAGGMMIWPLFGTTNQLLAGLTLLIVSLYLMRQGRPFLVTMIPMAFLLVMTTWAMIINLGTFFGAEQWLLLVLGALIFILEMWLLLEGWAAIKRVRAEVGDFLGGPAPQAVVLVPQCRPQNRNEGRRLPVVLRVDLREHQDAIGGLSPRELGEARHALAVQRGEEFLETAPRLRSLVIEKVVEKGGHGRDGAHLDELLGGRRSRRGILRTKLGEVPGLDDPLPADDRRHRERDRGGDADQHQSRLLHVSLVSRFVRTGHHN